MRSPLFAALGAALPALLPAQSHAQMMDETPRIAVMSAFAPEWGMLKDAVEGAQTHKLNGNSFITGTLAGQDVVLFLSGISMVNAAMTTQLALDHFAIDSIVFSGIAGGVDPSLNIGDVVVAGQWMQYLEGVFGRETGEGYAIPPFMSSDYANYGMIFTGPVGVTSAAHETPEDKYWFESDPALLAVAQTLAQDFDLTGCNSDNACLSEPPKVVVGGNGVSGMTFMDNADFRGFVYDTFDAQVVDMESAAVAHVAYANDVPFIAFRSLSDLAGGGEGENEMGTFFSLAAANSAALVTAFLGALE